MHSQTGASGCATRMAVGMPGNGCNCEARTSCLVTDEELVIWIPARLMWLAKADAVLRNSLLRGGVFPAKLSPAAAARQWGAVYMNCSEQERAALLALLKSHCFLQREVRHFLQLRAGAKEGEQSPTRMQVRPPTVNIAFYELLVSF